MLENNCDGSQTHPNVNRREARYKIRDCINFSTISRCENDPIVTFHGFDNRTKYLV